MVAEERETRTLTLRIDRDVYERARRAAHRASLKGDRSISLSQWVQRAIQRELEREKE